MDRDDYRFRDDREGRYRQERESGIGGERYRASENAWPDEERMSRSGYEFDEQRRRNQGLGRYGEGRYGEGRYGEGRSGEGRFSGSTSYDEGRFSGRQEQGRGFSEGRFGEGRYGEGRFGEGRYEGRFGEERGYYGGQDEERFGARFGRDWGYGGQQGQVGYGRGAYERFGVPREGYQSLDESYRPGRYGWAPGERTMYRGGGQGEYGRSFGGEGSYGEERDMGPGRQLREFGGAMASRVRRAFRGPKGYRRSDERIREDVCDLLGDADDLDASDIEVTVSNGEVTLSGMVPERAMKWQAEQITDNVSGVNDIHNQIKVRREGREAAAQTTAGQPGTFTSPGRGNQVRS